MRAILLVLAANLFTPAVASVSTAGDIATPERVGPEFSLSNETIGYQQAPSVASTTHGQVVAAWSGPASTNRSSPSVIWTGIFDRSGRVSADTRVVHKKWVSSFPTIAGVNGHDWVVLWTDFDAHDGSGEGVFGRQLDGQLQPTSRGFQVNTETAGRQIVPDVAMGLTGQYLAVWYDPGNLQKSDIKGRLYESSGSPASAEFAIAAGGWALPPRVAALDERYVVTWAARDAQHDFDVYFRIYDSNGKAGVRVRANHPAVGSQSYPDVATCSDGRFIIVWGSSSRRIDQDGGISGQWFDSAGQRLGEQLHINTYTKATVAKLRKVLREELRA